MTIIITYSYTEHYSLISIGRIITLDLWSNPLRNILSFFLVFAYYLYKSKWASLVKSSKIRNSCSFTLCPQISHFQLSHLLFLVFIPIYISDIFALLFLNSPVLDYLLIPPMKDENQVLCPLPQHP